MSIINDKIAKACKSLMLSEPFYGYFLIGLNKKINNNIPTAGVSKKGINIELSVNAEFFTKLPDKHQIGLLKHELLHISFGHLILRDSYSDHKLFNIAADLEINQYIDKDYLPEGGISMEMFVDLELDERAGTDYYYKKLEQACEDGNCSALESILKQMDGNSIYDHPTWKEFEELSEADQKLVQKQIDHQLKETSEQTTKRCGNIPGELSEILSRLMNVEPPSFNWKQYLRRFVGNSSISYTKKLRRKYNKRYAANPGLKIKFKNHILVGVDTSGSVSSEELKEFMNELGHMHKTGHQITVAQCDTQIGSIEVFNPKKDWDITGRGGTDFQPVIDHYNEKKGTYTALIYLTDGEAYTPTDCPKNALWVHSSSNYCEINKDLPGQSIQIN